MLLLLLKVYSLCDTTYLWCCILQHVQYSIYCTYEN